MALKLWRNLGRYGFGEDDMEQLPFIIAEDKKHGPSRAPFTIALESHLHTYHGFATLEKFQRNSPNIIRLPPVIPRRQIEVRHTGAAGWHDALSPLSEHHRTRYVLGLPGRGRLPASDGAGAAGRCHAGIPLGVDGIPVELVSSRTQAELRAAVKNRAFSRNSRRNHTYWCIQCTNWAQSRTSVTLVPALDCDDGYDVASSYGSELPQLEQQQLLDMARPTLMGRWGDASMAPAVVPKGNIFLYDVRGNKEIQEGTSYNNAAHAAVAADLVSRPFRYGVCSELPTDTSDGKLSSTLRRPTDKMVRFKEDAMKKEGGTKRPINPLANLIPRMSAPGMAPRPALSGPSVTCPRQNTVQPDFGRRSQHNTAATFKVEPKDVVDFLVAFFDGIGQWAWELLCCYFLRRQYRANQEQQHHQQPPPPPQQEQQQQEQRSMLVAANGLPDVEEEP
ncbi:hypothetical protein CONLIGDRAFT_700639 [Coniochaeta ligniaria NRRL 30616]|uniref:Uncharacterized protein n=1 Tax=Coniochaeta ligniaria NRRL 30616 TaxID=1408157 RepID=A0A1J7JT90_9PEZI|nr:hypothetical protein CONLIGDRAFT_700639 [Coniochaeta ligniaria NRRL 30616]